MYKRAIQVGFPSVFVGVLLRVFFPAQPAPFSPILHRSPARWPCPVALRLMTWARSAQNRMAVGGEETVDLAPILINLAAGPPSLPPCLCLRARVRLTVYCA
eukprot:3328421-Rhodomonas_salina.1